MNLPSWLNPAFWHLLYAVSLYSYYFAEVPLVGAVVAFSVLAFLAVGYFKHSSATRLKL